MPDYRAEARRAAKRHGVDPDVFERQINQESGFNPGARSPAGAAGIAQIMPATARGWGVDPMNPRQALDAAAKNMREYVDRYGGYENALRAYNAGPGAIERSKGYAETNNYVRTILGGRTPSAPRGSDPAGSTPARTRTATTTDPGVDNRVARAQLIQSFLGRRNADPLEFAISAKALRDIAPTKTTQTVRIPGSTTATPSDYSGGGTGSGRFTVSGPNPGRLKPELTSFANKVAGVFGGKLEGLDGSSHSRLTVNGNVSEHSTGNATDVFKINGRPAQGDTLLQAGRAALIAAGMPREQAMKAKGGLYNVGRHQIIFLTNEGGNHFDHLHISTHAR